MDQLQRTSFVVDAGQNVLFRSLASLTAVVWMVSLFSTALNAEDNLGRQGRKGKTRAAQVVLDHVKAKPADHPLTKPLELIRQSRKALEGVHDYTATFSKRERVGRGGRKMVSQTMIMKFREKPFSVYFHFRDKATHGREAIFVSGRNHGKLLVHESGFASIAGTLSFAPTASDVMKENRYPITEVGLKNLVEKIISQWETEVKYGETTVKYYNQARLGSVECLAIESTHPQPRRQFKYHKTRVYLDKKSKLLVRLEQYGWPRRANEPPPVIEEYTYSNVRTNLGLRDIDFDRHNPNYSF